jgi:hypothetical protein
VYLHETFDGPGFPPDGWIAYSSHPYGEFEWELNDSDHAGGTAPEAWVDEAEWASGVNYTIELYTPALNTAGADGLVLQFKHHCVLGGWSAGHEVFVHARSRDSADWVDVTPWQNPAWMYYSSIGPETVTIDLTPFIGPGTRVVFWILVPGISNDIDYWSVDDVKIMRKPVNYRRRPQADTGSSG